MDYKHYIIEYREKIGDEYSKRKVIKVNAESGKDAVRKLRLSSELSLSILNVYKGLNKKAYWKDE